MGSTGCSASAHFLGGADCFVAGPEHKEAHPTRTAPQGSSLGALKIRTGFGWYIIVVMGLRNKHDGVNIARYFRLL